MSKKNNLEGGIEKPSNVPSNAVVSHIGTSAAAVMYHIGASAASRLKRLCPALKCILVLLATGAAWFASHAHESFAMLYLLADNGKKSGRADGNVYMRNGRIRGFKVPKLVQNNATQTQRASLGLLSSAWNALSDANRSSWINATGFFTSDRFGRPVPLVGKQLFVSLSQNLFNIGRSSNPNAPTPAPVLGITSIIDIDADVSDATIDIDFEPTPTDADVSHLLFMTAQFSAGVNRPSNSAFRLLQVIPTSTASPFTVNASDYNARFGNMTAGRKIFIKLIPVNRNTGQAGVPLVASTIVVA